MVSQVETSVWEGPGGRRPASGLRGWEERVLVAGDLLLCVFLLIEGVEEGGCVVVLLVRLTREGALDDDGEEGWVWLMLVDVLGDDDDEGSSGAEC